MIATMRRIGMAALLVGFVAGPAPVAIAAGMDNVGPAEAAGSTGYPGSTPSPSGLNIDSFHGDYVSAPPVVYGGPYGAPYGDAACNNPPPPVIYGGILGFECRMQ
jgi:hypothetical protein